jgi:hypothetical protein
MRIKKNKEGGKEKKKNEEKKKTERPDKPAPAGTKKPEKENAQKEHKEQTPANTHAAAQAKGAQRTCST